jgi:hypothetical protein
VHSYTSICLHNCRASTYLIWPADEDVTKHKSVQFIF